MADASIDPQARALVTPEGVDLRVRLATAGERAVALLIDAALIIGVLIAFVLMILAIAPVIFRRESGETAGQIVVIIWLLGFFLLRNFYFTIMECSPRAATFGKRIMGLRVAARNGGVLSADAVVTRNAMRELELYLPLSFLFSRGQSIDAWIILMGAIWCLIFMLFPLFNRDRLRVGDMVAGTWVLKTPKQKLLPDLVSAQKQDERFVFTEAQLSVYGVKELQVLETVLRSGDSEVMSAVADRIRDKIGWKRTLAEPDREFLNAYYSGLRRRLEQKLLFGVRKRDKHDRT